MAGIRLEVWEIHEGTPVEVTTAGGDQVSMVALTAVVAGGTCP
ncbi:hypothetical protein I541_5718 [Mycobacteroides abscessus]|nr:hypothetical protein I541_5718 [Mycobacteroides abscessus]